jgi:phosphoglycerate dehydrogenase-like enzyme
VVLVLGLGPVGAGLAARTDLGAEIRAAEYAVPWEEISARRRGVLDGTLPELPDALRSDLADADVLFGFYIPRRLTDLAPRLRWVSTPSTGLDHLRGTGVLESAIDVTNVGGLFGAVLAEHAFALLLYFAKQLGHFGALARERTWRMGQVGVLQGRTLGLVGVGNIGQAVASRAKAFEMRVLGLGRGQAAGRTVAHVDELFPRERLHDLLAASDYVVVAVAETPETRGMIGAAELAVMKPDAVLVNVARGTVLDEPALVAALRAERLAGAGLDVFAEEPLPADSPLWTLPNALVTPHVAGLVPDYMERAAGHFEANLRRFVAGEALLDRYDRGRGY